LSNYLGNPGDLALGALDTLTLRRYFSSLIERSYRPASLGMHYRVLHAFFNWCVREGLIRSNPLEGIPHPKAPKLYPFTLDDAQIQALIRACDRKTRHGFRNYLILLLFLDCGPRLGELIDLRVGDVSLPQRALRVRGKGAKERIVFMGARTTKAMRRWLELRASQRAYTDHLFIDRKGEPLKPRWVQEVIYRLGKRAGLKVRLSPHKLRHVSATLAVRNGMDAFTLQRLYGWESVETAMRYVHAASPALREAHMKASPIDRLLA
jgi:site-specific recombinase XerD